MDRQNESAAWVGTGAAQKVQQQDQRQHPSKLPREDQSLSTSRRLNHNTKRAHVLRVFLDQGSVGLNCLDAVRLAHDYVLRTTVSELSRYNGIQFNKRYEQVSGHNGSVADCVRYSLTPEGAARARCLLGEAR
jgi:hypothetical protein